MEFIMVNALADTKEVKIIKEIVDALSEKLPYLIVTPFKYGKIGDDTLVSFKIEKSFHQVMIEKLTFNNIRLVVFDERTKMYVQEAKNQSKSASGGSSTRSSVKAKLQKTEGKKSLDELINEGDYSEVLKISRDVTLPIEEIEKAKNSIDSCIQRSISNAYNEGMTKKFDVYKNVEKLMKIASDNTLRTLQKIDYMKQAGLNAVEICSQNRDYVADLINISNNNTMHSIVNIKAAIKFGELILSDRETYKKEIYLAKRNLNTRWLLIAFSAVEKDVSHLERDTFNNLIDFIRSSKS